MRKMTGMLTVIALLILGPFTLMAQGEEGEMTREGEVDLRPIVNFPHPGETIMAEEGMRANVTIENLGDIAANGTGYVSLKVKVPSTGDIVFNPFNRKLNFTGGNELGPGENVTVFFSNWTTATKGSYLLEVEIIYLDDNSTNNKVTFTIYVKSSQWPGPIELTWSVDPPRGHTDDLFRYEATYGFNTLPDLLLIEIDRVNYSMIESDPSDIFPDDGKGYYFETYLEVGEHSFRFWVEVGTREMNTTAIRGPWVNITLRNPSVMPVEGYITSDFLFKVRYGSVDNDPPDEIFVEIDELRFNLTRDTPTTSYISANVEFRGSARGDQILRSPMTVYFICRTGGDEYRIGPIIEGGPRMEKTNLTGVVRDQEQTSLEGVLVELTPGVSTTTNASGAYRLSTYFGMEFELRYSLEGYENVFFNDIDLIGAEDHVINPIMTLIPGGALLEGYVTDEEGILLKDVTVSLDNIGIQHWFTTNLTGHYLFEDLPRIEGYTLSVESHIYEDHSISVDLTSEGYKMVNITLEERAMSIYLDPHSGIVPVDQGFILTFPRPVNRSTLAFRISNATEVLFSTLEYDLNDTMVTLDPVDDLLYDMEYRITLDEGVEDMNGTILSWRPLGWTVTARKQAFSGLDIDPSNDEEGVLLDADIHLWFGIGLEMETFEYELSMRGGPGGGVLSNISYEEELEWSDSGRRSVHITIDPDPLEYGTGYLLEIGNGLLDHYGRSVFTQPFSLEFRTEDEPDSDGDGVPDSRDRFPDNLYEWEDTDGDGIGDNADLFPLDRNEWEDTDGDGRGNAGDLDDDNDGMPDSWELEYGLDPLDPADFDQDPDGDGYTNLEEFRADTDPQDKGSHPEDGQSGDRLLLIIIIILIIVGAAAVVVFFLSRKKGPTGLSEE